MKISPISAVDVKKIKAQKYNSNPVKSTVNEKQYDANKMFGIYFGKDLVSFKGIDFNQTIKDNYFQLPFYTTIKTISIYYVRQGITSA